METIIGPGAFTFNNGYMYTLPVDHFLWYVSFSEMEYQALAPDQKRRSRGNNTIPEIKVHRSTQWIEIGPAPYEHFTRSGFFFFGVVSFLRKGASGVSSMLWKKGEVIALFPR